MGSKNWVGELQTLPAFKYDFAVQGGAVGTINLGNLPDNFIVTEAFIYVDTAMTSGGSATVVIGEDGSGDDDGYFATVFAVGAGAAAKGGGALISDGVHVVAAAKDGVLVTIGTAALTAGAFRVFFRGFQA